MMDRLICPISWCEAFSFEPFINIPGLDEKYKNACEHALHVLDICEFYLRIVEDNRGDETKRLIDVDIYNTGQCRFGPRGGKPFPHTNNVEFPIMEPTELLAAVRARLWFKHDGKWLKYETKSRTGREPAPFFRK